MDDVIRRSVLRRAVSQRDIWWTEETSGIRLLATASRSHARLPFDDPVPKLVDTLSRMNGSLPATLID